MKRWLPMLLTLALALGCAGCGAGCSTGCAICLAGWAAKGGIAGFCTAPGCADLSIASISALV